MLLVQQHVYNSHNMETNRDSTRRAFVEKGFKVALLAGLANTALLAACNKDDEQKKVSPPEDLMQEHGLLNRVLLIYDNCLCRLAGGESFSLLPVNAAASVIRAFVEDYHEKQEENYLFPRFKKAGQLTDLVNVLLQQHQAGRRITDHVLQLTAQPNPSAADKDRLVGLLTRFNTMYRPHEAREDTVLFPAFRNIVSRHEYDALGEEFEKNEQRTFGKGGFEIMVERVAGIERQMGIYELDRFTPAMPL